MIRVYTTMTLLTRLYLPVVAHAADQVAEGSAVSADIWPNVMPRYLQKQRQSAASSTYSKNHSLLRFTQPTNRDGSQLGEAPAYGSIDQHQNRRLRPFFDWIDRMTGRTTDASFAALGRTTDFSNNAFHQMMAVSGNVADASAATATNAAQFGRNGIQNAGAYSTQLGRIISEPFVPAMQAIGDGARSTWLAARHGLDQTLEASSNFGRVTGDYMANIFSYRPDFSRVRSSFF